MLIVDCLHTDDTDGHGCPQADFVGERESSEFKRNLNGGPEADSFGERQLENNKYPQMTQMDTDGGPQADGGGEQQLSSIGQQLKEKFVCVPWMICEPNEKEGKKLGHPTFRVMRQSCRAYSLRVKYRPNLIAN